MEEIANQFQIEPGIIASKLDLKKNDVILITIDADRWDIEEGYNMFQIISKAFPDNQIVMTSLKSFTETMLKQFWQLVALSGVF
jgi:hypothetical protein